MNNEGVSYSAKTALTEQKWNKELGNPSAWKRTCSEDTLH